MVTLSGVLETDMDEGVVDEEESQEGVEDAEESEDREDDLAEGNMRGDSLPEDNLAEYNTDNACVNKLNGELTFYKLASDNAFAVDAEEKFEKGGENGEDPGEDAECVDSIEESESCKEDISDIIVVHNRWKYQFEVKI